MSPIFSSFSSGGGKTRGLGYGNPEIIPVPEGPPGPWFILMATNQSKSSNVNNQSFGWIGGGSFGSANINNTSAVNRTTFGQGTGVYHPYFSVRNINYYALVSGNGNHTNVSSHSYYVGWQATSYPSGSQGMWQILRNIDIGNNQGNRAGQNYNQGNPATGIIGSGHPTTGNRYTGSTNYRCNNGSYANKFVLWGINHDSDDDSQALCGYDGNLSNGMMDAWRGSNPPQTMWSIWGADFHSQSNNQRMSHGGQGGGGWCNGAGRPQELVYLMGYSNNPQFIYDSSGNYQG